MLPPYPSLNAILTAFHQEAESDYPSLQGNLCIFDVRSGSYIIADDFDFQAHGFADRAAFEAYLTGHTTAKICREDNHRGCADKIPDHNLMMIFLNLDYTDAQCEKLSRQDMLDAYHTLDHELAHLVIPAAFDGYEASAGNALLAENIAETYAMLRHHQRFQESALPLKYSALMLASHMLMETPSLRSHFFYPTIRAAENLAPEKLREMDRAATCTLAETLARQHTPPQNKVEAILRATAKCRKAYSSGGLRAALPVLADVAFAGKADDITRLAIDVSLHYLNTPGHMLVGPQWQKLRRDLKEFDLRLSQNTLLADTRHIDAPPIGHRKRIFSR